MEEVRQPPYAFQDMDADDVQIFESVTNAEGFDCQYRQMSAGAYRGVGATALLNDTVVFRERHSQPVFITGAGPAEEYSLGVSMGAPAARRFQGRVPAPMDILFLQPGACVDYLFDKDSELAYVQLSSTQLRALGMAAALDPDKLKSDIVRGDSQAVRRFMHALRLALEPLPDAEPARQAAMVGAAERRLLLALSDALSTVSLADTPQARHRHWRTFATLARQAQERMENTLDEPIPMLALCSELECSLRRLNYVFTQYFGVSPSAYHHKLRMNAARRALSEADPAATTVTTVATDFGFWHLGRFAREYKRMFGESPSKSLASKRPQRYGFLR